MNRTVSVRDSHRRSAILPTVRRRGACCAADAAAAGNYRNRAAVEE